MGRIANSYLAKKTLQVVSILSYCLFGKWPLRIPANSTTTTTTNSSQSSYCHILPRHWAIDKRSQAGEGCRRLPEVHSLVDQPGAIPPDTISRNTACISSCVPNCVRLTTQHPHNRSTDTAIKIPELRFEPKRLGCEMGKADCRKPSFTPPLPRND